MLLNELLGALNETGERFSRLCLKKIITKTYLKEIVTKYLDLALFEYFLSNFFYDVMIQGYSAQIFIHF